MQILLAYLIIFVMNVICDPDGNIQSDLRKKLLQDYNRNERPVFNGSATTNVYIVFIPTTIVELDQETETLSVDGYVYMRWRDERLTWIPEDFKNLTHVDFKNNELWIPDIFLFYNTGQNVMDERDVIYVYMKGFVSWYVPLNAQVPCLSNYKYYPFDTHSCSLEFGSWTHASETLYLRIPKFRVRVNKEKMIGGIWNLKEYINKSETIYEAEAGDNYSYHTANFTLVIERNSSIYRLISIVPLVAAAVITLGCFWLELSSIARHAVGLANFLMVAINLLCLVIELPGGTTIPVLAQFSATCVSMAGIFVLETVILSSAATKINNPPEILRGIVNNIPDLMLCGINYGCESSTENQKEPEWRKMAIVFDRLFFYVFSFIYLVVSTFIIVI